MEKRFTIPKDYAPRLRKQDEIRKAKREKCKDNIALTLFMGVLWLAFLFAMAGVYFVRVDGWAMGWQPLALSGACVVMVLGVYFTSGRIRRVLSVGEM